MKVSKTTLSEEQDIKDQSFLKLTPGERLVIHEQLRKKIWGDSYNSLVLDGLKVRKKQAHELL